MSRKFDFRNSRAFGQVPTSGTTRRKDVTDIADNVTTKGVQGVAVVSYFADTNTYEWDSNGQLLSEPPTGYDIPRELLHRCRQEVTDNIPAIVDCYRLFVRGSKLAEAQDTMRGQIGEKYTEQIWKRFNQHKKGQNNAPTATKPKGKSLGSHKRSARKRADK